MTFAPSMECPDPQQPHTPGLIHSPPNVNAQGHLLLKATSLIKIKHLSEAVDFILNLSFSFSSDRERDVSSSVPPQCPQWFLKPLKCHYLLQRKVFLYDLPALLFLKFSYDANALLLNFKNVCLWNLQNSFQKKSPMNQQGLRTYAKQIRINQFP